MKYIIMCGGPKCMDPNPVHFTNLNGERILQRTVNLLRDNGINDIAITTSGQGYDVFGVPVIEYNSNKAPYHWVNAFYLVNKPVCYIFGDVFFSKQAIRTIVETETDSIEFFASAPPFHPSFIKRFAEPFAYKVVDNKYFADCVERVKQLQNEGKFRRGAIAWELWQVIKGTPLNRIDYTNYTKINDFTCDIDVPQDAATLITLINNYGLLKEDI